MTNLNRRAMTLIVSVFACTLIVCTLAGCAPKTTVAAENTASAPAAPTTSTTSLIESGTANEEDVNTYCLSCHLASDLPSWNKENIDAAMVESMLPTMSGSDIQALTAYFAAVEPQAQSEGQH